MYKNQLQELAQRSCFDLPSYACTREGPDHAPRFKACVKFNGEVFESPTCSTTLRQAEHAAAEVALNVLSTRGPSRSLTARVLDETGVYKNLLQETAHRAGIKLPVYTTVRSGPGHVPVFTCSVELAGMNFTGDSAKTKKQAEKNAAIAAWSALKTRPNLVSLFENSRDQNEAAGRRMICGGGLTSSSSTYKKQNISFVSLLPPPKPRTTSKILPPQLVQVQMQEVQAPALDHEHQRDEDEWLRRSTCSNASTYKSRMGFSIASPTCNYRQLGGYNSNNCPQRYGIAPAVQIRSVIPVCAAAPVRPPPPPPLQALNPPILVKEAARNASSFPSSELNSAQLTTVFNDKLQLR